MKYLPVVFLFLTSSAFALSTLTLDSRYFSYGLDGERNIVSLRRGEVAVSPYVRWTKHF